ncbi:MAG: class I SAM-dependent methyltransferase [Gemmatimonadaceae bacterium]
MSSFLDHFSGIAASYASYRPRYPAALFAWLADLAPDRKLAWDCGTGNGQAAEGLATYFGDVVATDPSVAQLTNASRVNRVAYLAMTAEQAALAGDAVSLVTVAQALHWFKREEFYREAGRVLRPGGVLAVWSYPLAVIDPHVDALLGRFHTETVGPYWPTERSLVDSGYQGIELPYPELSVPAFEMEAEWDLHQLGGYLTTWSAVSRYRAQRGEDPVPAIMGALGEVWGNPDDKRRIRWPLALRVARKVD